MYQDARVPFRYARRVPDLSFLGLGGTDEGSGNILSDEKSKVERLSQWYPVACIERTQPRHRPVHQLAHDFALLVAGKPPAHIADLQHLRKLFWEGSRLGEFVSIGGQGWKICLPFSV